MNNNVNLLTKFTIEKFNGDQNVTINFKKNQKVVVAENGSGKTTIMNLLFNCLDNNIRGLDKYDFHKCILEFDNEKEFIFLKSDIDKQKDSEDFNKYRNRTRSSYETIVKLNLILKISNAILDNNGLRSLESFLYKWFEMLNKGYEREPKNVLNVNNISDKESFLKLASGYGLNFVDMETNVLLNEIFKIKEKDFKNLNQLMFRRSFIDEYNSEIEFIDKDSFILTVDFVQVFRRSVGRALRDADKKNNGEKEVLDSLKKIYLPTYRRIEQDSVELLSGEIRIKEDSALIFGITDVLNLFDRILEKLDSFVYESFKEINESVLNNLISGEQESDYLIEKWKSEEYFQNVLERVGLQIDASNKLRLKEIYKNRDTKNKYLLKIIKNMCEIYDEQSIIQDEIDKYVLVCNKYLFNKSIVYDKAESKIQVKKDNLNGESKIISFPSLSSGEKQIISLFAKLYLAHLPVIDIKNAKVEDFPNYWVLFDEPELSLSVDWQEMLLPDILSSNRCKFLFATTHSPFIFNNDLRFYTSSINECITEV